MNCFWSLFLRSRRGHRSRTWISRRNCKHCGRSRILLPGMGADCRATPRCRSPISHVAQLSPRATVMWQSYSHTSTVRSDQARKWASKRQHVTIPSPKPPASVPTPSILHEKIRNVTPEMTTVWYESMCETIKVESEKTLSPVNKIESFCRKKGFISHQTAVQDQKIHAV